MCLPFACEARSSSRIISDLGSARNLPVNQADFLVCLPSCWQIEVNHFCALGKLFWKNNQLSGAPLPFKIASNCYHCLPVNWISQAGHLKSSFLVSYSVSLVFPGSKIPPFHDDHSQGLQWLPHTQTTVPHLWEPGPVMGHFFCWFKKALSMFSSWFA